MLNITAHGNIGKDPELKNVGQNQVASFSLAVRTGKDETTWMNCAVWGKRAQTAAEYLCKGAKITIAGQGKLNSYTTQDGTERQSLNVNVTDFTLPARQAETSNDNIPF
jgi:single-strand DNA-binding protein